MDIRPIIVGPDLSINPDLVLQPFAEVNYPTPAIQVSTRDIIIIFGENSEVGVGLEYCRNVELQGHTGKKEVDMFCKFENGQYHIKGLFDGNYSEYFINELKDGSYRLSGNAANIPFDFRIISNPNICSLGGKINGERVDYELDEIDVGTLRVKGKEGEKNIEVNILYTDEGIKIKGNHGSTFVEYSIISTGEEIKMSGITQDKFSNMNIAMTAENELAITGKPSKVPVDYNITLYENGVAFNGNTGFHHSEYGFILENE